MTARTIVVDASAMVDLLVGSPLGDAVRSRLEGRELHAPAHFDAEVLSALGRLHRAGALSAIDVSRRLAQVAVAPIRRHDLASLLDGAWRLRHDTRLVDGLYVELASRLNAVLITTDRGLAGVCSNVELVTAESGDMDIHEPAAAFGDWIDLVLCDDGGVWRRHNAWLTDAGEAVSVQTEDGVVLTLRLACGGMGSGQYVVDPSITDIYRRMGNQRKPSRANPLLLRVQALQE